MNYYLFSLVWCLYGHARIYTLLHLGNLNAVDYITMYIT